jgi:hypothetical protein
MAYIMDDTKEMAALFRKLSPENQSHLLVCAELCHTAERAVKKSIHNQGAVGAANQVSDIRRYDDEE